MSRVLGRKGFAITLLGDMSKGLIVMWVASALQLYPWAVMLSLLAVLIGHIWPIQLDFRGGKGIAVTLGALLIFDCRLVFVSCLIFCLALVFSRKYNVSGFIAIITLPMVVVLAGHSILNIIGIVVVTVVVLFAHRTNMRKFVQDVRIAGKMSFWKKNRGRKHV